MSKRKHKTSPPRFPTSCGDNRDLTVDHITPLVRGGAMADMSNLQTLCMRCNRKKGAD